MLGTILLIILVLALLGGLPQSNLRYGGTWGNGYGTSGVLGVVLVVVVVLVLVGRL